LATLNPGIRQARHLHKSTNYGSFLMVMIFSSDPPAIMMTCSTMHHLQPSAFYLESHLGQREAGEKAGCRIKVGSDSFLKSKIQVMNNLS
jgi:hypothetical protein